MNFGAQKLVRAVRPLSWTRCDGESTHWWETNPEADQERHAVVFWLRELGKVAWWISEGERTLALGFVDSLDEPSDRQLEQAKRSAAQRWWEIYT